MGIPNISSWLSCNVAFSTFPKYLPTPILIIIILINIIIIIILINIFIIIIIIFITIKLCFYTITIVLLCICPYIVYVIVLLCKKLCFITFNWQSCIFDILKMPDVTFLQPRGILCFTVAKLHFSKCISWDFFFWFFNRHKASS